MYYMYAHMHDVSPKNPAGTSRGGNSGYDDVLQMGMARIQQKGLATWRRSWPQGLEGLEGWWPRGFPKSITISPFWLGRFE